MDDTPDFVIAGGSGTSASNPETLYANEKGIPVISFAEALGKYVVRKNSIVCAGTWGKTTISALLSFILSEAGMRPGYFSGGVSLSHPSAALSDSDWSVVEGDEYQVSISDHRPKFAYYSPTHLLLTSVSWIMPIYIRQKKIISMHSKSSSEKSLEMAISWHASMMLEFRKH